MMHVHTLIRNAVKDRDRTALAEALDAAAPLGALAQANANAVALNSALSSASHPLLLWLISERHLLPTPAAAAALAHNEDVGVLRAALDRAAAAAPDQLRGCLEAALPEAARCGSLECMRLLLEHGAEACADTIAACARHGGAAAEAALTQLQEHGLDMASPAAGAALREVVRHSSEGSGPTQLLLAHGAPPDAVDKDGRSALCFAAAFCNAPAAAALIAAGADVRRVDRKGEDPLSAIHPTSEHEYGEALATLKVLLDAGADINSADSGGWRLVHTFADEGFFEGLAVASDQGADLGVATGDGTTVWELLAQRHAPAAVWELLPALWARTAAAVAELRQREALPQGLRALIVSAAAEARRAAAARADAEAAEERVRAAEAAARDAEARLARAQARLAALRAEGAAP
jgi:hypothetical protein